MPNRFPDANKKRNLRKRSRSVEPISPYEKTRRNKIAKKAMRKMRSKESEEKKEQEREKARERMMLLRAHRKDSTKDRKPYAERTNDWKVLTKSAQKKLKTQQRREQRAFHKLKQTSVVTYDELIKEKKSVENNDRIEEEVQASGGSVLHDFVENDNNMAEDKQDSTDLISNTVAEMLNTPKEKLKPSEIIQSIRKKAFERKIKLKYLTKALKISHRRLMRQRKDKRGKPCVNKSKMGEIIEHYAENSRNLPLKQKDGRFDRKVLEGTLREIYATYKANHQNPVSFATFCRLRPENIKCCSKKDFMTCLCEYCLNAKLKLEALRKAVSKTTLGNYLPEETKSLHSLCKLAVCNEDVVSNDCYKGNCDNCKDKMIFHFKCILDGELSKSIKASWKKWTLCEIDTIAKSTTVDESGKKSTKTVKVSKKQNNFVHLSGTAFDLVNDILHDMKTIPQHLFVANHQQTQRRLIRVSQPFSVVVLDVDYSQNISVQYREEPQSAHFNRPQFTLFPVAAEYFNEHEGRIREEILLISNDLTHDVIQADIFVQKARDHLINKRSVKEDCSFHVFSDRCPNQFSNKYLVHFLSKRKNVTWNFYGVRHGKNASDTAGANFKTLLAKHIAKTGDIIDSCEDFERLKLPEPQLKSHRRSIITIPLEKMVELRTNYSKVDVPPIKNIKKIHQIQSAGNGFIGVRSLTCYCNGCIQAVGNAFRSEDSACGNAKMAGKVQWLQLNFDDVRIDENSCSKCSCVYENSKAFPWLQCCTCPRWYCRTCLPNGVWKRKKVVWSCERCT